MRILLSILGIVLILIVLGDAFETVVLPRLVTRRIRLARLFYRYTWKSWSALICSIFSGRRRETYLGFYGPLSLLLLLILWATVLIIGFGLMYWASGNVFEAVTGNVSFATCIYFSGTTFFTLGLGDAVPRALFAKMLTVFEAGIGFGFLAVIISYLPVLNQSFFRRETSISLLDAHVGSPPTAAEILRRHVRGDNLEILHQLLYDWEKWSAEFHESHLSYPLLAYFRSQHENQSWLAALTSILDTCAFIMAGLEDACECQAELTFAIAKHAIVDLSLVFRCPPRKPKGDRFSLSELTYLHSTLTREGLQLREVNEMEKRLNESRRQYEPYVHSLSDRFCLSVPPWISAPGVKS